MSSAVQSERGSLESTPVSPTSENGASRFVGKIPREHLVVLVSLAATYTVALTYLCQLRVGNFYTGAWDLGINQQMLWTTTHGFLLYETPDRMFFGTQSFLGVHSTYVALLVVPLYSALPYQATLFALQNAGLAASIFPLYLLARKVIPRPSVVFALLALFLLNFGIITALLFDFHWEAFIPLEFLWLYVLIRQRSYRLSLIPMFAGFITLEVFPFLVGGIVVLVLYERVRDLGLHPRALFRDKDVRVQIGFLLLALVAYLLIRVLQYVLIPQLVGPQGESSYLSHAVTSPFGVLANAESLPLSALYWVLLLASLGFVPIFSPKSLLLSLPWFLNSVLLVPTTSNAFGNQYTLLAMATLSVALVEGFANLSREHVDTRGSLAREGSLLVVAGTVGLLALGYSRDLLSGTVGSAVWAALLIPPFAALLIFAYTSRKSRRLVPGPFVHLSSRASRFHRLKTPLWIGVVAVLIAFNVGMSPINPTNFQATQYPGYSLRFGTSPVFSSMEWIVAQIPPNAVILASDNLFTFVANDPNAWATPWYPYLSSVPPPFLPFNGTHLPTFVLIDSSEWSTFPTSVQAALLNESTYGLAAYIYTSAWPGTVYLFELGYTGVSAVRDATPPLPEYFFTSSNLSIGPGGVVVHTDQGKFGTLIESRFTKAIADNKSDIWFGPYLVFPSGHYRISFSLAGSSTYAISQPHTPVLFLDSSPFIAGVPHVPMLLAAVITAAQLNDVGWESFTYNITLTLPLPLIEFRGYLYDTDGQPNGQVTLNYIELTAD